MKNILVTGGCGFIGSEVVSKLLDKGYNVRVVDNLSKPRSSQKQGYQFLNLDLTDKENALKAFKDMDICINMAAKIGGIGYFHKYPATILSDNNKIYSNTFEAAVENKLERMLYMSSSMVFERATSFPSKESDIEEISPPISSYGFSKLSGEWYCRAFNEQFGLEYSIVRPFNAYGINEYPEEQVGYAHVIPDLIKKILDDQYPLEMLGDGKQTRCLTHVRDIAEGTIAVMESKKAINQDFNISNPQEIMMYYLAQKIWYMIKSHPEFQVKFVPGFRDDIRKRVPDTTKAKELLGWQAKISLEEGLPEVINWVRKEYKK